ALWVELPPGRVPFITWPILDECSEVRWDWAGDGAWRGFQCKALNPPFSAVRLIALVPLCGEVLQPRSRGAFIFRQFRTTTRRHPSRGKEESRWRGEGPAARLSSSRVDWLAQPMC